MKSRAEVLREALQNDNRPISVDISCTVYNHGKYLREALSGMLMQKTTFPFRIIIHDDASTDDSADIIREYQALYPDKIVAVIEDENLYQNGKSIFAKMFPYYTAKYIASCEGDDYWIDKDKLQKQVDYLETHPDCISCYHNILPVDEGSRYDESLRSCYVVLDEGDYTDKEIRDFNLKTQTASLVRRNLNPFMSDVDKMVYQSTKCNGDEKILILCGSIGRVHYLSDVMAAHRRVFYGDSYTARQNTLSEIDRLVNGQKRYLEKCKIYRYLTKKRVYPFNRILFTYLCYVISNRSRITYRDYKKMKNAIRIPFYAYLIFVPYVGIRLAHKIWRTLIKILV